MFVLFIIFLIQNTISVDPRDTVYFSSCSQSTDNTRKCPNSVNQTDFLLSLKKGGTNILSAADYTQQYFLCEEYTFDCGYIQKDQHYTTISNGIQLNMTQTQFDALPMSDTTLKDKIKPYVGYFGSQAACGMNMFPLTLTPTQSNTFFADYMNNLTTYISTLYTTQKGNGTQAWTDININIKTAILQTMKEGWAEPSYGDPFWQELIVNNYSGMSSFLKDQYVATNETDRLHASYLIDSVINRCQKYQSVNFLVDQSGSVTLPNFQLCLDFLNLYVTNTLDDISIMSIHFFNHVFQSYAGYGKTRSQMLSLIASKPYNAGGTYTGIAINQTIKKIVNGNYPNGVPKILAVLTDGGSTDDVVFASNYARNLGITMLSVGIGLNVNVAQLLQISGTASNYIQVNSFADIPKLADFISNFFCKTITTINLGDSIVGNRVLTPDSPNYYRIPKNTAGQYYQLDVTYQGSYKNKNESSLQSQVDPFPDQFTQYIMGQSYSPNDTFKVYFIQPTNLQTLKIKKNYVREDTVTTSYLAMRGISMNYNLSLKACSTVPCTNQRKYYYNLTHPNNTDPNTTVPNIPYTPVPQDLNIFIYIAIGILGILGCSALIAYLIKRKSMDQQQENKPQEENIFRVEQTIQEIQGNEERQKRSQKSRSSNKSKSKKSNKSKSQVEVNI